MISNVTINKITKEYGFIMYTPKGMPTRIGIDKNDEPLLFVGKDKIFINGHRTRQPIERTEMGVRLACKEAARELKRRAQEIKTYYHHYDESYKIAEKVAFDYTNRNRSTGDKRKKKYGGI